MTSTKKGMLDPSRYGPWAVVAGGSDGTGASFAREIAASGINLLLIARREGPLEAIAQELRDAYGVEVRTMILDLNAPDAAQRMADASEGLEVGLYVSNAGADGDGNFFLDTPIATIRNVIARNVVTVVEACHHFARPMRDRGRGGIILMGSGSGLGGQPGVATYSGAKGFVINLAESLWAELRGAGVNVIAIAAPLMYTPALQRTLGDIRLEGILEPEDVVRDALEFLPSKPCYVYAFGEPREESDRQTQIRHDRVLTMEKLSQTFFVEN